MVPFKSLFFHICPKEQFYFFLFLLLLFLLYIFWLFWISAQADWISKWSNDYEVKVITYIFKDILPYFKRPKAVGQTQKA